MTARTLRYYDEIGLLRPAGVGSNGHRYYEREQLLRLQQILLLRELGLDLATIGGVVDAEHDPIEALRRHHRRLLDQRGRLDRLAATVAITVRDLEEGTDMPAENLFDAMTPERAEYLGGLPKKRIAAGVLLSDDLGRTLLVEPTYKSYWQLPGVVVEADESPFVATARAIRHELGLSVKPGRLLVTDWVAPSPNRIEGLLFVYDGAVLSSDQSAAIVLPQTELRSWAWCTDDELEDRLPAHMLRRTRKALQARADDTTLYLENGHPA
ncbi:DNA-binding transcriptional MerR regulator/ADP-ribose pyrophosphatase YjhB (NUDIX family) [Rhodococcus sp. PvR099]|nr:DNA-binding transcriptional MerR regulator/ADP-ribose pyrophosphatase YjhB (NUDIX family) [Rhodococcus sp. PvR099]